VSTAVSDQDVALLLAHARLRGGTPLGAIPLQRVEGAVRVNGRDVTQCPTPAGTITTWSWPAASEPAASTTGPTLARKRLRPSALKTFLLAYTELTDPSLATDDLLPTVSRSRLIALSGRLLGPGVARFWSPAALHRDLIFAHLLMPVGHHDLALGPAVAGIDRLRREQLDAAAERLRAFPLWADRDRPDDLDHLDAVPIRLDDPPDDTHHDEGASNDDH
jgi:hypothetical protein